MVNRLTFGRKSLKSKRSLQSFAALSLLAGCGSGGTETASEVDNQSTSIDQLKPVNVPTNSTNIETVPASANLYKPEVSDGYWIESLQMDPDITSPFGNNGKASIIYFAFPVDPPTYLDTDTDLKKWSPAPDIVRQTALQSFSEIEDILNVKFVEAIDVDKPNVVAIGTNQQTDTIAYAYFPSGDVNIGSDMFISSDFLSKNQKSEFNEGYLSEVFVHELGHALGLKHPFEAMGSNLATLPSFEDNTQYTSMSYTDFAHAFSDNFKILDYLTLVDTFGVNPKYKAGDDTYFFSGDGGVFIIDGGGVDTISAVGQQGDTFIDLRYNSHSYLGSKYPYISQKYQMTISNYSDIENVYTGFGNDHVIGNQLDNIINTGPGENIIHPGEGKDVIQIQSGTNTINLWEEQQSNDYLIFDMEDEGHFTQVLNFQTNGVCDVIVLENTAFDKISLSPVLQMPDLSSGINNSIIRLISDGTKNLVQFLANATKSEALSEDKIVMLANNDSVGGSIDFFYVNAALSYTSELSPFLNVKNENSSIMDWQVENFML
jgi:serralysin